MFKAKQSIYAILACSFLLAPIQAMAQDKKVNELVDSEGTSKAVNKYQPAKTPLERIEFSSLFFTQDEYILLKEAIESYRKGGENLGGAGATTSSLSQEEKKKTAPRDVSLGGLVFVSGDDWTLWLNKKRITPDALPEEILDLKVHKEYVELDWYDVQTNQIYPLRLRPHQRFNLDARIFLP